MTQAPQAYPPPDLFPWSYAAIKKLEKSGAYQKAANLPTNCNFHGDELAVLRGFAVGLVQSVAGRDSGLMLNAGFQKPPQSRRSGCDHRCPRLVGV
jgi:hypothetical protein